MGNTSTADILIVENKAEAAAQIRTAIKEGRPEFRVHWVKDGRNAMHFIFGDENEASAIQQPKMIILNLSDPETNNMEVIKRIKTNPSTMHVQVISLLSSPGEIEIFSEAIRAGSNICLIKNADSVQFGLQIKQEVGFCWRVFE
ncbi:MAG: response regulator [Bacteroidota bacterium]